MERAQIGWVREAGGSQWWGIGRICHGKGGRVRTGLWSEGGMVRTGLRTRPAIDRERLRPGQFVRGSDRETRGGWLGWRTGRRTGGDMCWGRRILKGCQRDSAAGDGGRQWQGRRGR